ncbi:MAG: CHAT domain-containing protein [Fischerella sp. CENA71]|nr:CHAT domain-containing protein [Fischerella sp. CENA71]
MAKSIVLKFNRDANEFQCTLIFGEGSKSQGEITGRLPGIQEIVQDYDRWAKKYRSLNQHLRIRGINIPNSEEIRSECSESFRKVGDRLNTWLRSEKFLPVRDKLLEQLTSQDYTQLIIRTDCRQIQRFPWQQWDLIQRFEKAEVLLGAPAYEIKAKVKVPTLKNKVKILAILGDSSGINVDKDREFLQQLEKNADAQVTFLTEPEQQQINEQLWEQTWDILFFAGHSQTEAETGLIHINPKDCLQISDLKYGLKKAIAKGLQLAIFNSCDGLGLAWELEELQIPQVIVMREPVPDAVAQVFLKYFLQAFVSGQNLSLAVREARERLHSDGLDRQYPGASLLPVIYQSAATPPPIWEELGRRPTTTCPYRGLFAFQVEDAPFFFGREKFTEQLEDAVRRERLVTVIGPSGSGKSSAVFAGLIPRLCSQGNWQTLDFRPGDRPFHALAFELMRCLEPHLESENDRLRETRKLAIDLQQEPEALRDAIERIIWKNPGTRLLMVIDQFEELYTLCSKQECQSFLERLLAVVKTVNRYHLHLTLVLTLRADFLGYALSDRSFADVIPVADQMLGPMNPLELEQAITQPAKLFGVGIEPSLTELMLEEIMPNGKAMEPGYLPLVEFTLTQLWEKQRDAQLTHNAYKELGGIKEAIAHYADQVFEQLNEEQKERVRRIFVQLVRPGHPREGTPDTRRIANRRQLGEENWDLIQHLANVRLVTTNNHLVFDTNEKLIEEEIVEIVHEALIEKWSRLRIWLDLDREFRTWQEKLRSSIIEWKKNNRDDAGLLRGKFLIEAENWLRDRCLELSREEQEFIKQSITLRHRRRNITIFTLSTIFTIISAAAGIAWLSRQAAVVALEDQVNALSQSSNVLRNSGQPFDALLSAMRAAEPILTKQIQVEPNDKTWKQAQKALQWALFQVREQNRLDGHQDEVWSVSFSPDNQLIATASADKTVKIWSREGRELKTLEGHRGLVASVSFSPDSQTIATASFDKTIKLWNLQGQELKTIEGHKGWVYSVSFSPDGKMIASASKDGTVRLWNRDGKLLQPPFKVPAPADKSDGGLNTVIFSSDARTIAASSWDKTVRLWSLKDRQEKILRGHQDAVNSVSFSPDGKMLVTGSRDQTIKLWSLEGKELKTLKGHTDEVSSVNFSPDGQTIVSAGFDKTVRLWNLNAEELKPSLTGHNGQVNQVVFSPDGKTIASAGFDKTAKFWTFNRQELQRLNGHKDNVWGVAFSPDGKTIATASQDGTVKLWNRNGQVINTLQGHKDTVTSVTFSPDGEIIATTSKDKTVKLWSRDGKEIKTLTGFKNSQDNQVDSISFSPNGKIFATADWTGEVKLWSREGKEINAFQAHEDRIYDISFSPDGNMIATASKDKKAKLWNLKGKQIKSLDGHSDQVFNVSFSPDGEVIATSSRDGTIQLWNLDGELLKTIDVSSVYPDGATK